MKTKSDKVGEREKLRALEAELITVIDNLSETVLCMLH